MCKEQTRDFVTKPTDAKTEETVPHYTTLQLVGAQPKAVRSQTGHTMYPDTLWHSTRSSPGANILRNVDPLQ